MSKELLSKNTAGIFSTFLNQPHWGKEEMQEEIKKLFLKIRDGVGSKEEYLHSLLGNVTFQYANTNTALSFLRQCIEEEQFFLQESFQSIMMNVPKQVEDSNFIAENMNQFKEFVYKGSTIQNQVVNAERFFSHTKLVNQMLVEFIGTFLHPDNRDFMANYLEYSSEVVIETVMHYCQTYSNLILEQLDRGEIN